MKKTIILLLSLAVAAVSFGQEERSLSAIFSYATFNNPDGTPYVETYLSFDGNSLQYETQPGIVFATVDIVLMVKQRDSVFYAKKYSLHSPRLPRPDYNEWEYLEMPSFMDLQRFALPNGDYTLTFSIKDHYSTHKAVEVEEEISLRYGEEACLSSVQPIGQVAKTVNTNALSRNGYDMTPYVDDFFPATMGHMSFYFEVYNIEKEVHKNDFSTVAYIEESSTGRRFEGDMYMRRHHPARVVPVFGSIDIRQLPSGNYNLVVEARTKDNELMLYRRVPFMRSNPEVKGEALALSAATFAARNTEESQMNYYLSALYPIANPREDAQAEELARTPGRMEDKQVFFYQFWLERDAMDPEGAWREYKKRLDYVEQNFSYPLTPGYRTDRGRVYLQYGAPSFVRDEKNFVSNRLGHGNHARTPQEEVFGNPSNGNSQGQIFYLPYQLWRYDRLPGDDANRCFIFWDQQRSGFYLLLNSNAKGEVQDPGWERRLSGGLLEEGAVGAVGDQFNRGF